MLAFSLLVFAVALFFGAAWGAAENRCWKEAGESVILNNFKLYHLLMALLFCTFNAFAVCLIFGVPRVAAFFSLREGLFWVWLMLWDTLILDVVWWVIRYRDITHLGQVMFSVKFLKCSWIVMYPTINEYDYGRGNAWHLRDDWDNWLHPPLVVGCFWWWWMFAAALAVLSVGLFLLSPC
jgi:hypothetical protein